FAQIQIQVPGDAHHGVLGGNRLSKQAVLVGLSDIDDRLAVHFWESDADRPGPEVYRPAVDQGLHEVGSAALRMVRQRSIGPDATTGHVGRYWDMARRVPVVQLYPGRLAPGRPMDVPTDGRRVARVVDPRRRCR